MLKINTKVITKAGYIGHLLYVYALIF